MSKWGTDLKSQTATTDCAQGASGAQTSGAGPALPRGAPHEGGGAGRPGHNGCVVSRAPAEGRQGPSQEPAPGSGETAGASPALG